MDPKAYPLEQLLERILVGRIVAQVDGVRPSGKAGKKVADSGPLVVSFGPQLDPRAHPLQTKPAPGGEPPARVRALSYQVRACTRRVRALPRQIRALLRRVPAIPHQIRARPRCHRALPRVR